MLNLVNRIWVYLQFAQGGVLVCSGKSDPSMKLFCQRSSFMKLGVWVIKAHQDSDLCHKGLFTLQFGITGLSGANEGSYNRNRSIRVNMTQICLIGSNRVSLPVMGSWNHGVSWGVIIPQDSNLAHCHIWVTRTEIRSATRIWFSHWGWLGLRFG